MKRITVIVLAVMALAVPATATVVPAFTDIADSVHRADILTIAEQGVTKGCTPTRYCPEHDTTRGQMAAFINRAGTFAQLISNHDRYDDIADSVFRDDINTLEYNRVIDGCTGFDFCPDGRMDRTTMARWLGNAGQCPYVVYRNPVFDDVPASHPDRGWIEGCWSVGVVYGHDGNYFPDGTVTREQMASFLVRAFNL